MERGVGGFGTTGPSEKKKETLFPHHLQLLTPTPEVLPLFRMESPPRHSILFPSFKCPSIQCSHLTAHCS